MIKLLFSCLVLAALPGKPKVYQQRPEIPSAYAPNPTDMTEGQTSNISFTDARAEASHWLNLVDQMQYTASWQDAGPLLKDAVTAQQWQGAMQATRAGLGNMISRQVGSHRSLNSLAHGSRGNFISIDYSTQFSGNHAAAETVILMTDTGGSWRVISYFLKTSGG